MVRTNDKENSQGFFNRKEGLMAKGDWYEKNIEPGVRSLVRLLRDNGINTECSCEHEKYIQCQFNEDGFLWEVDKLLFSAGFRNYTIDAKIIREDGHLRKMMKIDLVNLEPEEKG